MNSTNKGLGLLETLFAVGVLALIFAFGLGPFNAVKEKQTLNKVVEDIEKLLLEAKTNTMASVNASNYGVHFETSSATLFSGSVFSPSAEDNKMILFGSSVIVSDISLSGGGQDVIFNRIKGDTDTHGAIQISLVENPSRKKTVNIFPIGTFFTE